MDPNLMNRSPSKWDSEKFLEEMTAPNASSIPVPTDTSPNFYQRPEPNQNLKAVVICNDSASSIGSSSVRKDGARVVHEEDEVVEIKGPHPSIVAQSLQSEPSASADAEEYAAEAKA